MVSLTTVSTLLGSAQTYIGVLATLAVLSLFYSKNYSKHTSRNTTRIRFDVNNYLLNLLLSLKDEILQRIEWTRKVKIKEQLDIIQPFINSVSLGDLSQESINLIAKASMKSIELPSMVGRESFLSSVMTKGVDKIHKAKGAEYVTLYTFFSSILILTIDALFPINEFVLNWVMSFFALSIPYTSVIWLYYFKDTYPFSKPYKRSGFINLRSFTKTIMIWLFLIFGLLILSTMYLWHCKYYHSYNWSIYNAVVAFILIVYFWYSYQFNNTLSYNRRFVITHFIYITSGSLLYALFICILKEFASEFYWNAGLDIPFKEWQEGSKIMLITRGICGFFILANILLIPFIIIYFQYWRLKRTILTKIEKNFEMSMKKFDILINRIQQSIKSQN